MKQFIQSFMFLMLAASVSYAADTRADFLKLIEKPKVPLDAKVQPLPDDGEFEAFHLTYASSAGQIVPGILLKPAGDGRKPVVIALHGTGGTKQSELPLMRLLAAKGFIAVAIDGAYHGERTKAGKGSVEYEEAILQAWRDQKDHPFYYDTAWDVMRLIDYLQTRDDVDASRIGIIGISKGGTEAYLAAAVDRRIAAAVPCIGVQSFQWATENDSWHSRIGTIQKAFDAAAKDAGVEKPDGEFVKKFYDRVAPGLYGEFDGPSMVPLIAPRPLLTINGDSDARTPMPGLQICFDEIKKAYHADNADDHFQAIIEPNTAHKVTADAQQQAIDWFVKWLGH